MRVAIIFLASTISVLSGCSLCEEVRTRVGVSELTENFSVWMQSDVSSYVLTYGSNGGQLPPSFQTSNRVVVESGVVSQVDIINSNAVVIEQVSADRFGEFFTVDDLFAEILELNSSVKSLEVQYDESTGIPAFISVDPNLGVDGCGDVSDDEFTITSQIVF